MMRMAPPPPLMKEPRRSWTDDERESQIAESSGRGGRAPDV
jgi:hypothetical protein